MCMVSLIFLNPLYAVKVNVTSSVVTVSWFTRYYCACTCTHVVYFRVMRRLCRREWNWLRNWRCVSQHSWEPWQRTTWSRRVTSDFNSVLFWHGDDVDYNFVVVVIFVLMQIRTSVSSAVRAWCASIGTLCATTCGTAPMGVTSPSECATVSPEYATITPDHNTERSELRCLRKRSPNTWFFLSKCSDVINHHGP